MRRKNHSCVTCVVPVIQQDKDWKGTLKLFIRALKNTSAQFVRPASHQHTIWDYILRLLMKRRNCTSVLFAAIVLQEKKTWCHILPLFIHYSRLALIEVKPSSILPSKNDLLIPNYIKWSLVWGNLEQIYIYWSSNWIRSITDSGYLNQICLF